MKQKTENLIFKNEVMSDKKGIKVIKGYHNYFVNSDNHWRTLGEFETLEDAESFADSKRK